MRLSPVWAAPYIPQRSSSAAPCLLRSEPQLGRPGPRAVDEKMANFADRAVVTDDANAGERRWSMPWFFVQLADTQLGMQHQNRSWAEEMEMARTAVDHINRLRPSPKFVVVCGDMTNALPIGGGFGSAPPSVLEAQVASFKAVFSQVDRSIPLVCVCGNHDVGERPNAVVLGQYRSRWGADYFAFWAGGCRCLVLNSSLHAAQEDRPFMCLHLPKVILPSRIWLGATAISARNVQVGHCVPT
jgi:hypothetical protein